MDTNTMRRLIRDCPKYKNSATWAAKVDKMPDNQVLAIYTRFVSQKLI